MLKIQNVSKNTIEVKENTLGFLARVAPGDCLPANTPEKVLTDLKACVLKSEALKRESRWKIIGEKPAPAQPAKAATKAGE
jgi:hypothetical protein